ncbi:MAG: hypothetical protein D6713_06965, partial [Deltaproteobacteria bacterium]
MRKSDIPLAGLAVLLTLFLSSLPARAADIFPVLDPSLLEGQKVVREITLIPWDARVIDEVKETAEKLKGVMDEEDLFVVLSVTTDAVGDEATNRRLGADIANWVGILLVNNGIPPDRIGIVPTKENASYLTKLEEGFRAYQKCRIAVVRGSDLLKRAQATLTLPEKGEKIYPITIISPREKKTDRSSHILKGKTHRDVKILAVTVNKVTKTISAIGGEFETPISLTPGENRITITGRGPNGVTAFTAFSITYEPPTPTIVITSPENGDEIDITKHPFITVRGRVESDDRVTIAYLIHNDFPQRISVREDGTFEEKAVLLSERDTFRVEALSERGFTGISPEIEVKSTGLARQHMTAFLTWDAAGVDLDLIVRDGEGHVTSFDSPDRYRSHLSIPEGRLVIDDRDGFGPEVFNL